MLLDSDTAIKVAYDIIHDVREFFEKWPLLPKSEEDAPDGYVDFEFSDGSLLRVPCAYVIGIPSESIVREYITFKSNGRSAVWNTGDMETPSGILSGLISDSPINAGNVIVDDICPPVTQNGASIILVKAFIEALRSPSFKAIYSIIQRITVNGTAVITDGAFDSIVLNGGTIDMDISRFKGGNIVANTIASESEQISPVEKMNAWTSGGPETDAAYTGYIPFFPLDDNGNPINGFDNPLMDNPFFPDWYYMADRGGPWNPAFAWVPSRTMPSSAYWRDSDGLYWHKVNVVSDASWFGACNMIYPPRCRVGDTYNDTLAPLKADADGMVITVKQMRTGYYPICITDKYEYAGNNEWSWAPGEYISVKGPFVKQFICKRVFTETAGNITSVEYQFLPLGEMDVRP